MGKNKGGGGGGQNRHAENKAESTSSKPKNKSKGQQNSKVIYLGAAIVVAVIAVGAQQAGMLTVFSAPAPEPPRDVPVATDTPPKRASKKQSPAKQQKPRPPPPSPSKPVDPSCVDEDESCEQWARAAECDRNKEFMHTKCRASCHICASNKPKPKSANACEDTNNNCATWAAIGECQSNPGFMLTQCPVTCKMCQSETCKDDLPDCTERCRGGAASNYSENLHCYSQPELVEKCAWTCGACKEHRFDRPMCKRDKSLLDQPHTVKPGMVNKIFQRIVDEQPGVTVLSSDPWILAIDDFVTSEESDAVRDAGSESGTGWARSQAGDGVQAARTSSTSWCKGKCLQNWAVKNVESRVSSLMG